MPVTRAIHVECHAGFLYLAPEPGSLRAGKIISLDDSTSASLPELLSAVSTRIESWGLAGVGMHWHPVLEVQVAEGGANRFEDLQSLFDGTDVEVRLDPLVPRVARHYPESATPD
jgi:hypothetical protein